MNTDQLFVEDEAEAQPAIIVDRSTLERWAECPQRAYQSQFVTLNGGPMAEVGSAVHDIVARVVAARSIGGMSVGNMAGMLVDLAEQSPPHLQPRVLYVLRRSAWKLARLIGYNDVGGERHPDDLLRYDGGEGVHSGQLAAMLDPQMPGVDPITFTGEVDLLCAGPSIREVDLNDWKSGWRWYTAAGIAESFQFQSYAWLIFQNFPSVARVNVRVAMLAEGETSSIVPIDRDDIAAIECRLRSAARLMLEWRATRIATLVPANATPERCAICDVVNRCPLADWDGREASDPAALLRTYAAVEARADRLKTMLTSIVRKQDQDIVADELAFGTGKPKAARAPSCDLYTVK